MLTRESYLNRLMREVLAPMLEQAKPGSTATIDTWRVSVGFPGGGSARKRIGECWSDKASSAGLTEMFISPILESASEVDHVLLHEMIHAAVGTAEGHKGPFKALARAVGLTGKMTATTASEELRERLNATIADTLGAYPHARLDLGASGVKKQTTRMIKAECMDCGYTFRTAQKWIDTGLPTCVCGGEFNV